MGPSIRPRLNRLDSGALLLTDVAKQIAEALSLVGLNRLDSGALLLTWKRHGAGGNGCCLNRLDSGALLLTGADSRLHSVVLGLNRLDSGALLLTTNSKFALVVAYISSQSPR